MVSYISAISACEKASSGSRYVGARLDQLQLRDQRLREGPVVGTGGAAIGEHIDKQRVRVGRQWELAGVTTGEAM